MLTYYEITIYALVNYVPFAFLALYPFLNSLRFSKRNTLILFLVTSFLQVLLLLGEHFIDFAYGEFFSLLSTLVNIGFFLLAVKKQHLGRLTFSLLVICNMANVIVISAKCLEGILFPEHVYLLYHISFSLCLFLVELLVLPAFTFYIKKNQLEIIHPTVNKMIWNYLWLIPGTFYLIWFYIFYHFTDQNIVTLALKPKNTLFLYCIMGGQLFIYSCILLFVKTASKLLETEQNTHISDLNTLQYQTIREHIQETRILRHDLRHHVHLMLQYIEQQKYDALKEYLQTYCDTILDTPAIVYCSNSVLNMMLVYYAQLCKMNEIDFSVSLSIPSELGLSDVETTILFGNLLENAITACMNQKKQPKSITFKGIYRQQQLVFTLDNTFENKISQDHNGNFISTKHEGIGLGTQSVKKIINSKNGMIHTQIQNNLFCVSFLLPLSDEINKAENPIPASKG